MIMSNSDYKELVNKSNGFEPLVYELKGNPIILINSALRCMHLSCWPLYSQCLIPVPDTHKYLFVNI